MQLLTIDQVAERLGLGVNTVRKMIRRGESSACCFLRG